MYLYLYNVYTHDSTPTCHILQTDEHRLEEVSLSSSRNAARGAINEHSTQTALRILSRVSLCTAGALPSNMLRDMAKYICVTGVARKVGGGSPMLEARRGLSSIY